jgi:hypothetical protein
VACERGASRRDETLHNIFIFHLFNFLSISTFLFLHLSIDLDAACDAVGGAISSWGVSYGRCAVRSDVGPGREWHEE